MDMEEVRHLCQMNVSRRSTTVHSGGLKDGMQHCQPKYDLVVFDCSSNEYPSNDIREVVDIQCTFQVKIGSAQELGYPTTLSLCDPGEL